MLPEGIGPCSPLFDATEQLSESEEGMVGEKPPFSWRPTARSCCCGFGTTACRLEVVDAERGWFNGSGPRVEQILVVLGISFDCFSMAAPCAAIDTSPCGSGEGVYFARTRCNAAVCPAYCTQWLR